MRKSPKIIITIATIVFCGVIAIAIAGLIRAQDLAHHKLSIVATNFIGYDLAKAVAGSQADVKMLLTPGTDAHDFEPTPQDIIDITKADLFIYVGGESDEWARSLLDSSEIAPSKVLRLMDAVYPKQERESINILEPDSTSSSDHESEYDEHIWTSPTNTIKLVRALTSKLTSISPDNQPQFLYNQSLYVSQLESLDDAFRSTVANAPRTELIFADRFPFLYFVDDYGLDYYAAFPGCSEQTEASAATIAFLIDRVKSDHTPVVLKIELTSDALAQAIANETGAKVLELSAAHNISQEDFDSGVTYIDILGHNLAVLREALY